MQRMIKNIYFIKNQYSLIGMITDLDGNILTYCDDKKIRWYLKKNLATVDPKNPKKIMLNFEPSGRGE